MKKILIFLLLIIITLNKSFACLNGETKRLKDGTFLYEDHDGYVPYGHNFSNEDNFVAGITQLGDLYNKTKDLDYLSDKGLLLILLKRYDEAIKLYLEIEKLQPNRYSTASNIGTAYELIGQNENALKWIKKSVEIAAYAHKGSEWIHVKILEAKIKGEAYCTTLFLLNLDFGNAMLPKSSLDQDALRNLQKQLFYQLNERISFVKPKDKIVAQLLFDLGNISFLVGDFDDAKGNYNQAKEYGFMSQIIEGRIKEAEIQIIKIEKEQEKPSEISASDTKSVAKSVPKKSEEKVVFSSYLLYCVIGLVLSIIVILGLRQFKRKK